MNKIIPIPAFADNYIWAIHSPVSSDIVVVDPGDAACVFKYIEKNSVNLIGVLVTHHHSDHTAGIGALKRAFSALNVYGPANEKMPIAFLTHPVQEGDQLQFPSMQLTLAVIDIPGHTVGHIAYLQPEATPALFCGDTLFSCGCGRLFEGTPQQMFNSLEKIKRLSTNTLIYCGHEYTLANIAFAQTVDSQNIHLKNRLVYAQNQRAQNLPTLPVTLHEELNTNPFLRCSQPAIIQALQHQTGKKITDPIEIFTALRIWKNNF